MSTKIRINVTKEIIAEAMYCGTPFAFLHAIEKDVYNVSSNCAIARAIWKVIPYVAVSAEHIIFHRNFDDLNIYDKKLGKIELPIEAKIFIRDFDKLINRTYARLYLEPISFEIEIPDAVIDNISIEEITERLKDCKTVKLVNA